MGLPNIKAFALALALTLPLGLLAQMDKAEIKACLRMVQGAPTFAAVVDSLRLHDYRPDHGQVDVMRSALWMRFLMGGMADTRRATALAHGLCTYGEGRQGRFRMTTKGTRPAAGWPLYIGLHGGGGAPPELNDGQWEQMARYYLQGIDTGIYVAPRGPSDTWDLHFTPDAQAFYVQLIRDLVLLEGVDPDRVYLLGYSAGGDGVYQLAPRLAPLLAGASMSAGHHNGVSPQNLAHLPMLLQVGQLDDAYDRNKETVRYGMLLDSLQQRWPGLYRHHVYVHAGAAHSHVRDRIGPDARGEVLADPRAWLRDPAATAPTVQAATDAPTWLRPLRRDPYPQHLRWDAGTRMEGMADWYWISLDLKGERYGKGQEGAEVRCTPSLNRVEVVSFSRPLTLHLHEAVADLRRPLTLVVDGAEHKVPLHASLLRMAESIVRHQDPKRAAWQEVRLSRDAKGKVVVE